MSKRNLALVAVSVVLSGCQFAGMCFDDKECKALELQSQATSGTTSALGFETEGSCSQSLAMGDWSSGSDSLKLEGSCALTGSIDGTPIRGTFTPGNAAGATKSGSDQITLNVTDTTGTGGMTTTTTSQPGTSRSAKLTSGSYSCQIGRGAETAHSLRDTFSIQCRHSSNANIFFSKQLSGDRNVLGHTDSFAPNSPLGNTNTNYDSGYNMNNSYVQDDAGNVNNPTQQEQLQQNSGVDVDADEEQERLRFEAEQEALRQQQQPQQPQDLSESGQF